MFSLNKYTGMMKSNIRLKIMEVCEDINDMRAGGGVSLLGQIVFIVL